MIAAISKEAALIIALTVFAGIIWVGIQEVASCVAWVLGVLGS